VEPTRGPQYGHMCPNGHGELPPGAQFCPVCGAQAIYMPPPAAGALCPACGAALVPGARFCPKCGAPVPEPSPPSPVEQPPYVPEESPPTPPPPVADVSCPACGAALVSGARFCPECGAAIPEPSPPPVAEQPPYVPEESPPAPPPPVAGVSCPACGAALVPEARFCPECGATVPEPSPPPAAEQQPHVPEESLPTPPPPVVPSLCPKCGASLVPEAVFCPDCGHRLTQGADTASEVDILKESTSSAVPEPPAADTDETAGEWKL
jgi:uncharacterized OB-fold protein